MTRTSMSRWQRLLRSPHVVADTLAGVVLILIALVALGNIGSRAFFGQPLESSTEFIGSWLMVALVYLPLASSKHVRITALTTHLPRAVLRWVDGVVVVLSVAGLVIAVWATLMAAIVSFQTDESTVGLHSFPLGPMRLVICIGLALLCFRIISNPTEWLAEPHEEEEALMAPRSSAPRSAASDSTDGSSETGDGR